MAANLLSIRALKHLVAQPSTAVCGERAYMQTGAVVSDPSDLYSTQCAPPAAVGQKIQSNGVHCPISGAQDFMFASCKPILHLDP